MTIAKPLQVVCSPPKITSNFRPRVAYFQRRFGTMGPSPVLFILFLIFYSSPQIILSRSLSSKTISKVFLRIFWRPMTISKPQLVVCSPPKITSNFRTRVVYFQTLFGPMCPLLVFYIFFSSSPNTMLSGYLSRKNIPKVFSGFFGGP